ncbi:MAG: hypothetical protein ACOYOT_06915 [Bacteroidales bacterium]
MNKKYSNFKLLISGSLMLMSIAFGACTIDDPLTVVEPKTLEEYKVQMTDYLAKEKIMIDTARVGYNVNNYKSATDSTNVKAPYLAAVLAAQVVVASADVTITQIVKANNTLATPGKTFRAALWIADRRQLNDSIIAANALNTTVAQGNLGGQVLPDAKATFTAAIAKATSTRGATALSALQIKMAVQTLTAAKKTFLAAVIPTDLSAFLAKSKAYVTEQKTIVEASAAGYNSGEYIALARTNYMTAVLAANDSVNKAGISFDGISKAMINMIAPKASFIPFLTDHRSLNDTILLAETLNPTFVVGTAKGQVVAAAKTAFTTAITTAKTARETVALTDGLTKAARFKIAQAIFTIQASIVLGDLIIDSNALKTATPIGTAVGQVSTAANFTYNKAIVDATTVRNSGTSTYAQMTAAITSLQTATTLFTNSIKK